MEGMEKAEEEVVVMKAGEEGAMGVVTVFQAQCICRTLFRQRPD